MTSQPVDPSRSAAGRRALRRPPGQARHRRHRDAPGAPRRPGSGGPRPAASTQPRPPSRGRFFALALLAASGAAVTLALTHATVGYGVDSAVYTGVAHNLVAGRGPTAPMTFYTDHYSPMTAFGFHGAVPSTHFPPLYPAFLAAFESAGLSIGGAVRWSNATLHALNLVLVALLLSRVLTRRPWLGAVAGAAVLLTIGTWMSTHTFALSEVLFLTWTLAMLLALSKYLATSSQRLLVAVGACAAAGVLTRWVGVSLALTAGALIMARGGWTLRQRMGRAAVAAGSGAAAAYLWTLYGKFAGGSTPRLLAYHPPRHFIGSLLDVIGTWFLRPAAIAVVAVALVALVCARLLIKGLRPSAEPGPRVASDDTAGSWLLRGCAVFSLFYVLVVYAARTFFDASIPTSGAKGVFATFEAPRIYVALLPVLLVLVLAGLDRVATVVTPRRYLRWAAAVVPAACIAFAVIPASHLVTPYRDTERLLDATRPRLNATTRAVEMLPPDATIATNLPAAVYGMTGRSCLMVPLDRLPVTGERNPNYARDVAQMAAVLQQHNGYLVLYAGGLGSSRAGDPKPYALFARLEVVGTYSDGTIVRVLPRAP